MDDASRGARKGPPPPPRSSARPNPVDGSRGRTATAAVSAAGRPRVGAALVPFGLLAASTVLAVVLAWWSWSSGAGRTAEVSSRAVAGWVTGGVVALVLFAWFRAATMGRQADPYYVEPSWRPSRVAPTLAGLAWLAGTACAFLLGAAVARR
jgi:hypothetical protein